MRRIDMDVCENLIAALQPLLNKGMDSNEIQSTLAIIHSPM
jgi:hypothetical protein